MKILWLCNIVLPQFAETVGEKVKNTGGWLTGMISALEQDKNIDVAVAFPCSKNIDIVSGRHKCYGFVKPSIEAFEKILIDFQPDVIHIFGTEALHSNCMIKAAYNMNLIERTVISIQGLVSICSKHYTGYLSADIVRKTTLRDIFRGNIRGQQRVFYQRGLIEEETLRETKHVIGRTTWDRACVERINKEIVYHFCNETLRKSFYEHAGTWKFENCNKHSIFVTQYGYPIKGFHLALEAFLDVLSEYPDSKLYTTGRDLFSLTLKERLLETSYHKYLRDIITKNGIKDSVVFLGDLSEKEMCEQFLKTNVFVCSSSIENSPNSLGEAMLVGTPCISSDVGGVKDMLLDGTEGYIYPADEPYMCAYYIKKLFQNEELLRDFSTKACLHARKTHCIEENQRTLISIYKEIAIER